MTLLAPLWLLGLAALAVPVWLHLRAPRPSRPVPIGSTRLLEGLPPARARERRIAEPWLLALRLLLLALAVLALAEPRWRGTEARPAGWALVVPEAPAALADSLGRAGLRVTRLAPGEADALWVALARADARMPAGAPLVVAAPLADERFAGARPALAREITWLPVRAASRAEAPAADALTVRVEAARDRDARYVIAALEAAGARRVETDRADLLVRLGAVEGSMAAAEALLTDESGPAPEEATVRWLDDAGRPLLLEGRTAGRPHWQLRRRFEAASWPGVLEGAFADSLARLLRPARDFRPAGGELSMAQARPARAAAARPSGDATRDARAALWGAVALLFLLERGISAWRATRRVAGAA